MGTNRYLNWEKLYNMENNGYMQQLVTVEAEVDVYKRQVLCGGQRGGFSQADTEERYQQIFQ